MCIVAVHDGCVLLVVCLLIFSVFVVDVCWEESTPNPKGVWEKSVLFSILWSLGPKMAPRPSQEGSWGVLGVSWGALGGSWALFGGSWGAFEPS